MVLRKKPDPVDICVIGAGAAGAVVAKKLGVAGFGVVVLEAGPRFNPAKDYPTRQHDFEVAGPALFEPQDPRRDLYTWSDGPWFHFSRIKGVGPINSGNQDGPVRKPAGGELNVGND